MRRLGSVLSATLVALILTAGPAAACGGLIGPNGAVNLLRTTTLAGYSAGVEHYITAFQFAGGGGSFGSITPLPGVPTSVVKGGDWTLQRLIRETAPVQDRQFRFGSEAPAPSAEEILKVRIDALDLTVLRGGSGQIGQWAKDHGFRLPPDAPEVLDFYARRSQIFLAAAFDADAAAERGQQLGDGTPVHITIPTDDPWVPLRILALGKGGTERVEADVFLLTERRPSLMPTPIGRNGLELSHFAPATDSLLDDLRSDRDMEWVPTRGWLTQIRIDAAAEQLKFDLAIDASGLGQPSRVDAGFDLPGVVEATTESPGLGLAIAFVALGVAVIGGLMSTGGRRRATIA
ncbi:MAG: DUF2330 domain-containing protein [Chloroflexota bacterium]|nr:DUF2330 domain-containing protein [Chloroflexota bacterium]